MPQETGNQNPKRRINPGGPSPSGENDPKKKPKFSIYWIYGVIFLAIIGYNLMRNVTASGVETDQATFLSMVMHGDVLKMKTIRNKKVVRVFIKQDSLKTRESYYTDILKGKEEYQQALKLSQAGQPQLVLPIIDDKTFA